MQQFVIYSVLIVVIVLAIAAVPRLLRRVTDRGGSSDADAATTAAQALAWSDAFRGTSDRDNTPWEGEMELAPPIIEGPG